MTAMETDETAKPAATAETASAAPAKKKTPLFIAAAVALVAIACGGFYVHQQRQPHYIVSAVEKTLRDGNMLSSEFNIKEAKFLVDDGRGSVLITLSHGTMFGGQAIGNVILFFKGKTFPASQSAADKIRFNLYQNDPELEPFSVLLVTEATLNDTPFSSIDMMLLKTNMGLFKQTYKGPSLRGKVTKLREDGNHSFVAPLVTYDPSKLFPYSYE